VQKNPGARMGNGVGAPGNGAFGKLFAQPEKLGRLIRELHGNPPLLQFDPVHGPDLANGPEKVLTLNRRAL
jgi:hypothetical protein